MANRLTDSRKWDDDWFLELPMEFKLLWIYLLDKCSHAGLYKRSKKLEICCLDKEYDWDIVLETFGSRLVVYGDNKYFIPKFIEFQYGELNEENRCHKSVINLLKKEGLFKGLTRGLKGCTRKDKDKDKDKDKSKDIIVYGRNVKIGRQEYAHAVDEYGESVITEYIERLDEYIEMKGVKYKSHIAAIRTWLRKDGVPKARKVRSFNAD